MNFVAALLALLFSSIFLNVYLLSEREAKDQAKEIPLSSENNSKTNQNIFINCSEEAVSFIVNEWFLQNDFRFDLQQTKFSPKIFFPIIEYNNITKEELFDVNNIYTRHIAFNYPFVLRGATKKWKAFNNWKNQTYLLDKIGNHTIKVEKKPQGNFEFAYFRKDYKRVKMKFHKFLNLCENYLNEKFIYYWAEQRIPKILRKDIKEPKFAKLMNLEEIHIWHVTKLI